MPKSKEKGQSEVAQETADRVEDKPSDPTDIFATDFIGSDAEQEENAKADLEEEKMQYVEDAIDFGEFAITANSSRVVPQHNGLALMAVVTHYNQPSEKNSASL